MRVAHVGNLPRGRPNGVHAVIGRLCELLPSVGVTPEVWHLTRTAHRVRSRIEGDFEVFDLPVRAAPGRAGSHIQVPTGETRRWLASRRAQVDVLHLHSVFQPDHIWTAHGSTPYVLTPHGGYHERVLAGKARLAKRAWMWAHDARLLSNAAAVHALTASEAESIATLAPAARTVVLEAPLVVDQQTAPEVAYQADGPVLFIGRLDPDHKGLDLLIQGFAQMAEGARPLILAGPDHGQASRELTALATRLGVQSRVEVREAVSGPAKEALISSASVFVHTSRREGLPLGPLEAMGRGLPVLVSRETNLGDMVAEADAGVVVDAEAQSIADGLNAFFARSAGERRLWGRNAREAVARRFSWSRLGPEYRSLYARAAG
jgi:glycosyltransferase involved in cell wall biosynthesis